MAQANPELLYQKPLFELIHQAMAVHKNHWSLGQVRLCGLVSIKSGACSEDCSYCAQSARYHTGAPVHGLLDPDAVFEAAVEAKKRGVTHFCLSAAWRGMREGPLAERVIALYQAIADLDMVPCGNLGMLDEATAQTLAEAGVRYYNHNLDTSAEYYPEIVGAHSYQDRLDTIERIQLAGMDACVGIILGLGESIEDRISFLKRVMSLEQAPSSIPVNVLVPIPGTPLVEKPRPNLWEIVRFIAVLRICLPMTWIPLAAGRREMSQIEQALCLLAGANSLFAGEKLLTTQLPGQDELSELLAVLGLEVV